MKTLSNLCLFVLIAAAFAACDSNPIEDDPHHEHHLHEIHRLALVMDGEEIVVIEDNKFVGGTPAPLHLHPGDVTDLITLEATTEDGEEIHFDEVDDAYRLGFSKLDRDIVGIEQPAGKPWSFRLVGKAAGTTTLVLKFLHGTGDHAHADYVTPEIPIEVVDHSHDH